MLKSLASNVIGSLPRAKKRGACERRSLPDCEKLLVAPFHHSIWRVQKRDGEPRFLSSLNQDHALAKYEALTGGNRLIGAVKGKVRGAQVTAMDSTLYSVEKIVRLAQVDRSERLVFAEVVREEGFQAFRDGFSEASSPYGECELINELWMQGWRCGAHGNVRPRRVFAPPAPTK